MIELAAPDRGRWPRARAALVVLADAGMGLIAVWSVARWGARPALPPLWIDLGFVPPVVGELAVLILAAGVLVFTFLPESLRPTVRWAALAAAVVCAVDALRFHLAELHAAAPWSLSLPTAGLLAGWSLWAAAPAQRPERRQVLRRLGAGLLLAPGVLALCVYTFGRSDYRRPADAAVVFGAAVYQDGTASLSVQDRTRTACRLVLDGLVRRVVMSGGRGEGMRYSEPEVMRGIALRMGVPPEAVLVDEAGVDTRSTVRNVARLADERGWDSVLMVSHDYHLARIKMFARQMRLKAATVPAEESRPLARWSRFFGRELAAICWYLPRSIDEGDAP